MKKSTVLCDDRRRSEYQDIYNDWFRSIVARCTYVQLVSKKEKKRRRKEEKKKETRVHCITFQLVHSGQASKFGLLPRNAPKFFFPFTTSSSTLAMCDVDYTRICQIPHIRDRWLQLTLVKLV